MRFASRVPILALASLTACKQTPPPPAPSPSPPVAIAPTTDLSPPPDATATASGLRTKVMKPGTGHDHPEPQDLVEVHVIGWKSDGTVFDDSRARHAPVQFPVDGVIKGWSEGLQLMVTGETRRMWIPSALAYGDKPADPHVPAGPLVLEVELLTIIKRPRPLPAPDDLASPPGGPRTKLGLVYRVLKKGSGTRHPRPDSFVEFHYTGWRADGRMLDSTVTRADPSKLRLQSAGRVWAEALATMVAGEKARFWIPSAVAREMGGSEPAAVYDVELLAVR
jgi:FKBP-type peptidyl-prolyl cis-trans isomerase